MQSLNFWPCMIVCYTDRVYGAFSSHFYICAAFPTLWWVAFFTGY